MYRVVVTMVMTYLLLRAGRCLCHNSQMRREEPASDPDQTGFIIFHLIKICSIQTPNLNHVLNLIKLNHCELMLIYVKQGLTGPIYCIWLYHVYWFFPQKPGHQSNQFKPVWQLLFTLNHAQKQLAVTFNHPYIRGRPLIIWGAWCKTKQKIRSDSHKKKIRPRGLRKKR